MYLVCVDNSVRIPGLLDADIGSNLDDLLALLLALGSNKLNLIDLTTVLRTTKPQARGCWAFRRSVELRCREGAVGQGNLLGRE